MKAIDFKGSNKTWGKPESMTDEECGSLRVHIDGKQSISCWEPSVEEIKQITETGKVWLGVLGQGHPPVWLSGIEPAPVVTARLSSEN